MRHRIWWGLLAATAAAVWMATGSGGVPRAAVATPPPLAAARPLALRGTIGGNLRISMSLQASPGRPREYAGTYCYEKAAPYVPRWLSVQGTRAAAGGALTLTETDPEGKKTGRFVLAPTKAAGRGGAFTGTWESPDGSRKLPVSLSEAGAVPSGLTIGEGRVGGSAKKPIPYEMNAVWPRLSGAPGLDAFNRAAEKEARSEVARFHAALKEQAADAANAVPAGGSWDLSTGFTVRSVTDRAVSAEISIGSYMGGAHGSSWTHAVNVDRRTGARLTLKDLFAPSVDAPALLSRLCRPPLLADLGEEAFFVEGVAPKAENFQDWTMAPEGLIVNFDVYQVAPYAVGPREVILPWAALKPHLRADGPAAPFLR